MKKENTEAWKECKLGEICDVRDGTHDSPKQSPTGFPLITSKNLKSGCIDLENTYLISESDFWDINKRSKVDKFDILYSMIGTVGEIAIVKSEPSFAIKNVGLFKCKGNYELAKWVYYFMQSSEAKEELQAAQKGSTQSYISLGDLRSFPILLPPLPEQRAIASVLSSLDDKIDLLHRQNKTLEAMAETLFRQWFVEEADEGWEEGKISDLCIVITKGTTPTTLGHQFTETGINFVKAESITDTGDFIWNKFAKISDETHIFLNRSILQEGDILCSIAGTIGRVAITTNDILPANTNQAIAILRVDNKKCFPEFIYLFMKSALFREIMDGKIVHAVQPNLSLGEIGNSTLKIPPFSYLMNFKNVVQPIFAKKKENYNQIRTLEKLRDTLLPKLMSGEIRVKI